MEKPNSKEERRKQLYEEYLLKSQRAMSRAREYKRKASVLEQSAQGKRKQRNHGLILIAAQLIFLAKQKNGNAVKVLTEIIKIVWNHSQEDYKDVVFVLEELRTPREG